MIVRYPPRFQPGSRPARLVASVDAAASLLELAGVAPPRPFHGRPFWSKREREAVLIEYFSDKVFPRIQHMGYRAVRTRDWKYIHYVDQSGVDELYDLRRDPFELDNRINDRRAPLARLQALLRQLQRAPQ
jgi:arylsulfatase A-like enzyme